jgi:hypothetical protein
MGRVESQTGSDAPVLSCVRRFRSETGKRLMLADLRLPAPELQRAIGAVESERLMPAGGRRGVR